MNDSWGTRNVASHGGYWRWPRGAVYPSVGRASIAQKQMATRFPTRDSRPANASFLVVETSRERDGLPLPRGIMIKLALHDTPPDTEYEFQNVNLQFREQPSGGEKVVLEENLY